MDASWALTIENGSWSRLETSAYEDVLDTNWPTVSHSLPDHLDNDPCLDGQCTQSYISILMDEARFSGRPVDGGHTSPCANWSDYTNRGRTYRNGHLRVGKHKAIRLYLLSLSVCVCARARALVCMCVCARGGALKQRYSHGLLPACVSHL